MAKNGKNSTNPYEGFEEKRRALINSLLSESDTFHTQRSAITEKLDDIEVGAMLSTGLSSEMIAAAFHCTPEQVEETSKLEEEYVQRVRALYTRHEDAFQDYDYSFDPYIGRYPVRK